MSASLVVAIASAPAHRRQLAQLFGAAEAFLIVSNVEQARRFLMVADDPGAEAAEAPDAVPPACGLSVDSDRQVLRWRDDEVGLTPLEHALLRCLAGTPGQIWTYQRLHREVWGTEHLGRGSDLHSLVRRARRKLARLGAAATIHAVRGVGFRLAVS
ncbi:winged helix-turn-helix domain-containing protein [Micromonospora okii]|uniref:winged helix-turn-helix domain-containing protein n=1 Tax=Micromonospora okii TaxID=1182970 RepID=UPI001E5DC3BE|nr:winged helix-turn-helix domain-containing protein [Micromonospora okii]